MIQDTFNEFAKLSQVRSIAVGGSRAAKRNDEFSDYDVYVYATEPISIAARRDLLEKYCDSIALDNHYREHEDVCIMEDGTQLNIVYRELDAFLEGIDRVTVHFEPLDGCTTSMWNSLLMSRIAYDKGGLLAAAREKYTIPYPQQLKHNIISHHMNLIKYGLPSYMAQMEKAMKRKDMFSFSRRSWSRLMIWAWMDTSRADTGSSQTMILGFRISARARPTRCLWPPENSWGYR